MRSLSSRQSVGLASVSRRSVSLNRLSLLRLRSALWGATLVAGGVLVAPAPRVWAQSAVSDENGPKVQIIAPAYQDVLKGRARILVGIAAGQYNPATIELWVDDRAVTQPLPLSSLASMSFDWDTRRFSDGPHKLSVRVTDTQGFRGLGEVNIYINNENKQNAGAPNLKWKGIAAYQQLSGQAEIQLEAKNSFGVKWIIVKVAPTEKSNNSASRSWMLGGGATKFKFDTTKVADGLYAVTAKAWDALDQEGNAQTLTVGVVNSPINATTVAQSLDGLKKMAAIEAQKSGKTRVAIAPLPRLGRTPAPDLPPLALAKVSPSVPLKITRPSLQTATSDSTTLAPVFVPRFDATLPKTPGIKRPLIAKQTAKAGTEAELQVPAVLSGRSTLEIPQPSRLEGALQVPAKTKVFIARLGAPTPRVRTNPEDAALSAPIASVHSAPSPAISTRADGALLSTHLEVARLSLPSNESHAIEIAPVLSAPRALESVGSIGTAVASASLARIERTLTATAPDEAARAQKVAPRRSSRLAHVVAKMTNRVDKAKGAQYTSPAPAKTTGMPDKVKIARTVKAPVDAPQLSTPRNVNHSVVSTNAVPPSPLTKIAPKFAALPSRKSAAVSDAAPFDSDHPAITVSPIQTAFDSAIPKQHLVKVETTLKDLAAHYGLPVEMVAAANNWNANMRVIPGMVVLLPRQVKLTLNGKKVEGNVSSMLIGDTTVTAMRFLFEQSGGKLEWDAAKQEVIARKGTSTIRVRIGSKVAHVNDKQVMMQLAAFLFEGRTMVPARLFEEGLNAQVDWNPQTGHLVVAMVG